MCQHLKRRHGHKLNTHIQKPQRRRRMANVRPHNSDLIPTEHNRSSHYQGQSSVSFLDTRFRVILDASTFYEQKGNLSNSA
jgi:hypothetical protein